MLIRFYSASFPGQFATVLLTGMLLWSRAFIFPPQMPAPDGPGPLYPLLYSLLVSLPHVATFTAFVLMAISAFWINRILTSHHLIPKNFSLPALLFLVLVSLSPPLLTLTPGNISLFLLIPVLQNMLTAYDKPANLDLVFSASFFIGLASLFYPPFLIFFGYILLGFIMFRTGNKKEWIASILGTGTPFLYLLVWYIWTNDLYQGFGRWSAFFSDPFLYPLRISDDFWIITGLTTLWAIWCLYRVFRKPMEKTAAMRAKTYFFFWTIPFTFISYIYARSLAETHLVLFAPAFTLLFSAALTGLRKRKLADVALGLYILFVLLNNILLHQLIDL